MVGETGQGGLQVRGPGQGGRPRPALKAGEVRRESPWDPKPRPFFQSLGPFVLRF